jgi:hypothetical protein
MKTARSQTHPTLPLAILALTFYINACSAGDTGSRRAGASDQSRAPSSQSSRDSVDWSQVDRQMGRPGKEESGGVHRYSMPRSDLTVTSQGVTIKPALALGSWLAFKSTSGNSAVAMGDLVLTEQEYNRVIARLSQGGVQVTAVHKHLPAHSPGLWWTHVEGRGDPAKLAETVRAALRLTGTPSAPPPSRQPEPVAIDTTGVSQALGHQGKVNGGVYQVSIPRSEVIRASGVEVSAAMGTGTALNFQPTGGGKAAINGDFVMVADEVKNVVQALESSDIQVVALHNHMLEEEPRLFFLHFWANDDAVKLARGLRGALDKMKLGKS